MSSNQPLHHNVIWVAGNTSTAEPAIRNGNVPGRLIMTATCLFFSQERLLLCNPHPETWNTWMTPYGASTVEFPEGMFFEGMQASEIEDVVQKQIAKRDPPEMLVPAMLKMAGAQHNTEVTYLTTIYEIKCSASTNVWTLYCCVYYCSSVAGASPQVQHCWVSLGSKGCMTSGLLKVVKEKGFVVQDNIVEALRVLESIPRNL